MATAANPANARPFRLIDADTGAHVPGARSGYRDAKDAILAAYAHRRPDDPPIAVYGPAPDSPHADPDGHAVIWDTANGYV